MEKIRIQALAVDTLIGVYDWERKRKTTLLFNVELEADLSQAMASDNVEDTVDYARVAELIRLCAIDLEYELLEALGRHVMDEVLHNFNVQRITLEITKPDILPHARQVTVIMSQER